MTFAQLTPVPGTNGQLFEKITCNKCHLPGHYANVCPDIVPVVAASAPPSTTGTTLVQYVLAQSKSGNIDPDWILLDSQSTISVFRNPALLTNIRTSSAPLRALTNGGHQDSTLVGDFPNLGPVWFNPESIANILSLAEVRRVCRVTMDTSAEPALLLHRMDGSIMKFVEHSCGLYVFAPKDSSDVNAYSLLQTVASQKKFFTDREVAAANDARALYRRLGRPSEAEFGKILRNNLIRNCPITPDDAKRARFIYGPDIAALKGMTKRGDPAPHVREAHQRRHGRAPSGHDGLHGTI